jgi:hypothetical protein
VDSARERFQATFPFHPALLSVFERKWQSLPRFQKTRGVLRLLALWVSHAYFHGCKGVHRDPLIGVGTAPLDDPFFRAALFDQLGNNDLEGPVTTDIAGKKDAHAVRLDRVADDAVKKARLHQKVATVILFESNGGHARAEATVPEVRLAVAEPELDIANVESALEALTESCYYLTADKNRYRFSLSPNLNKLLTDRRAAVKASDIEERVKQVIQEVFKEKPSVPERSYFPEKSSQVTDRPVLVLVVLAPDPPQGDPGTLKLMDQIVREYGQSNRTFKSALIFTVPESSGQLREEARKLLAWEDIAGDDEIVKRLEEGQRRQLDTSVKKSARDLKEAVWRTYKYVVLLGRENTLQEIDLGLINSSVAGSLVELIVNRLSERDELTESVGVGQLLKAWPEGFAEWPTKQARNAFFASPLLRRVLKPDTIALTIADAVNQGRIGFAIRIGENEYDSVVFKPQEGFQADDVQFGDDELLLTAKRAQELIQPPHLARIAIQPTSRRVKPNETVSFSVSAYDQHGKPFPCPAITWTASGGKITPEGTFVAESVGNCTVQASLDGHQGSAHVEVAEGPPPPPKTDFAWKGSVPPQKWMNFYTKVLSRFASNPGLKLEVSFEVARSEDVTEAKVEEAKAALRELGLSEELRPT